MEPAGAVQQPGEEKRGDGLWSVMGCWPDIACPTVGAGWYVPIEPGKEQEFAKALLQSEGYTIGAGARNPCSLEQTTDCGVSGNKDGFSIGLGIKAVGPQAPNPPTTNASPKIWRDVSLRITAN